MVKNDITIDVLYAKKKKISPAYVSKHSSNREKQVILLIRRMAFACSKTTVSIVGRYIV